MFRTCINCDITFETFIILLIMKCFNSIAYELCHKHTNRMYHLESI